MHLGAGDVLAQRLAGDGDAVEIQRAGLAAMTLEDGADAAGAVDIFHVILARRATTLQRCGHARGDLVELLQVECAPASMAMASVCSTVLVRAAHGHVQGEGVVEGLRGQDVARADVLA